MRPPLLAPGAVVALALTLASGCTTGTPSAPPPSPSGTSTTYATAPDASPSTTSAPAPAPTTAEPPPSSQPTPTDGRAPVGVVVTVAGQNSATGDVEVAGYAETLEPDGTCTLHLASGGSTRSVEQAAEPDVTNTTCGLLTVPRTDLAPGIWTAELSYTSSRSEGRSTAVQIEVR